MFEASTDFFNWNELDKQIFISNDKNYNEMIQRQRSNLLQKGAISTYQLDDVIYEQMI